MTPEYTEEKLENMDKETIIQLFLSQQNQLRNIDKNLQLVLKQLADSKRQRFGRSSEKHEVEDQISFMEVDGKVVFFNEAEAVAGESAGGGAPASMRFHVKKHRRKRENGSRI